MTVTRYNTVGSDFDHVEHPDGEWVHFDDALGMAVTIDILTRRSDTLRGQLNALTTRYKKAQAEIERQSECERAMIGAVHSWSQRAEAAEDKLSDLQTLRTERGKEA